MPISMTIMVRSSVGQGGVNAGADVMTVQRQLNGQMNPPRVQLTVDGACGPKTRAMIVDFQKGVLGLQRPDGRIDPGGRTLTALNDPASESKWARMSIPPSVPAIGGGGNLTPLEQHRLADLQAKATSAQELAPWAALLEYLAANEVATLKLLLNVQGATQYSFEFFRGIGNLSRAGFTAREIAQLFSIAASNGGAERLGRLFDAMQLLGKATKLAAALKAIGNVATILSVLSSAVVAGDHFRAGRPGAAFAEIYGTGMGIALPWAGFLNAVSSVLYAINPKAENDSKFQAALRFLMAIEPIGAGQVGVDTAGTFIKMAVDGLFRGGVQGNDLDDLVARMRASPMRFWVEIGDSTGDWMGDKFGDWYYRNFLR